MVWFGGLEEPQLVLSFFLVPIMELAFWSMTFQTFCNFNIAPIHLENSFQYYCKKDKSDMERGVGGVARSYLSSSLVDFSSSSAKVKKNGFHFSLSRFLHLLLFFNRSLFSVVLRLPFHKRLLVVRNKCLLNPSWFSTKQYTTWTKSGPTRNYLKVCECQ